MGINKSGSGDKKASRNAAGPRPGFYSVKRGGRGRKKNPQKLGFAAFFIFAIFFGTMICVIFFAAAYDELTFREEIVATESASPTAAAAPGEPTPPARRSAYLTAVVVRIEPERGELELYDFVSGKNASLSFSERVEIIDKYGEELRLSALGPGTAVDLTYDLTTGAIDVIRLSVSSWKYDSVTGASVSAGGGSLSFNGLTYHFGAGSFVFSQDGIIDARDIDQSDVIDVEGYGEYVSRVELIRSHGTLEIAANVGITGAYAEIDGELLLDISETVYERLPEGEHRAIIHGTNIEPYTVDFYLERGGWYGLNTSNVKFKGGVVTFICGEPGARLFVDGSERAMGEPISASFGDLSVRATKNGFHTFEQTFTFSESPAEYSINLERLIIMGRLNISTNPPGAYVFIDDLYRGVSPLVAMVDLGERTLSFQMPGYRTIEFPMVISAESPNFDVTITLRETN